MSTQKQSTKGNWFGRMCGLMLPRKSPATSTSQDSQHLDTNGSPSRSPPSLPTSPAKGTSPVQPNATMNQSSTVPGPTGVVPTSTNVSIPAREGSSDGLPVDHAGAGRSPRSDTSQSDSIKLPSQVEETLSICPRFRIVLVGNTGVGKSSLVSSVFNVDFNGTDIDIAHDRIGQADISREHRSDRNPRFILHDSMGFEPGSTEKAEIVKSFLQSRAERNAELPDRVHAIWLCIETPRTGSRLLQTADEDLLELAEKLKIPVIVVLTKYDYLVVEHFRACDQKLPLPERKAEAIFRAERAFKGITKGLKVPFAPVSTQKEERDDYGGAMLINLTKVTRENLRDVEGSLWALWATAQQINARQKVDLSISEGLKKYWKNLGESKHFKGYQLVDCIERIHDDILKIWNFDDPLKLLSGEEFLEGMIRLVEPLSDEIIRNRRVDDIASPAADVDTGAVGSGLVLAALRTTPAIQKFLHSKYQKGVSIATYLAAYIINLILILYEVSMLVTVDPPNSLTRKLVTDALNTHRPKSPHIQTQVKGVAFTFKLEEKIAPIILDALPPLRR